MKKIIRRHTVSFKNAFSGIMWSLKTQPNFVIHALCSIGALVLGLLFQISKMEMVIIVFTIALGFIAEMINTSIEAMTDLITSEWKTQAKIAKDVAAGMMLMVACSALIIAGIIFVPYLVALF